MQISNDEMEALNRASEILSKYAAQGGLSREDFEHYENMVIAIIDEVGNKSKTECLTTNVSCSKGKKTNKRIKMKGKSKTKKSLYSENDILIEYHGIHHYSESSLLINLYIDNSSKNDINVDLSNGRVNKYNIRMGNSDVNISSDSAFLTSANFNFIIGVDSLKEYGIEVIERLDFTLTINKGGWLTGEEIACIPISIVTLEPVSKE